jgi:hypothetical protein
MAARYNQTNYQLFVTIPFLFMLVDTMRITEAIPFLFMLVICGLYIYKNKKPMIREAKLI